MENQLMIPQNFSKEQIEIIKNTVAKGTTDLELGYFLTLANSVGLNPFKKEIWCYKDGKGNVLIFAGRDGFLSAAQKNNAFNGIRSSYVCAKDQFQIDIPNNKIAHSFGVTARGDIIGAYAIAFRKSGEPTIVWADFKTYNKGFNAWKSHPGEMIVKVAEANALKKAFGLSGFESEDTYDFKNDTFTTPGDEKDFTPIEIITPKFDIPEEIEANIAISETLEHLTNIYNSNPDLHTNPQFMLKLAARKDQIKSANLQPA